MNKPNETENFLNQKPKRTTPPKGPIPYCPELIENRYAITWLKRNMKGEEGEKQLRELQKEIENEYGIKVELVAEKETEKKNKDEENQRNKLKGIIENQQWETEEKRLNEKPKEKRETFQERKAQRVERKETR